MRKNRRRSVWGFVVAMVLGLLVGTLAAGQIPALAHTWLGSGLVLTPWSLDLYVVAIRIQIQTNLAGLILALVAIIVYGGV